MGREQDTFEWVNAWAEATGKLAQAALPRATPADLAAQAAAPVAPHQCVIARTAATMPPDQLMRDIAEIERARDALALLPVTGTLRGRTRALTLVAPRTSDPVPVVIGGVFALVMLTVFGAAAAMTKRAR